jgi:hypothetical protein
VWVAGEGGVPSPTTYGRLLFVINSDCVLVNTCLHATCIPSCLAEFKGAVTGGS